jgi:hypothetical protein
MIDRTILLLIAMASAIACADSDSSSHNVSVESGTQISSKTGRQERPNKDGKVIPLRNSLEGNNLPGEKTCSEAFDHMKTVSFQEIQSLPPDEREIALKIGKEKSSGDPRRRREFIGKCTSGQLNVTCIMNSRTTMEYIGCFSKRGK